MVKKFNRPEFRKKHNKFLKNKSNEDSGVNNNYDSDEADVEQNKKIFNEISEGYIMLEKVKI